jgi:hypothetical protein
MLSDPGSEEHVGFIPVQLPGTLVQYFIEALDEAGETAFAPAEAPAVLASYEAGPAGWSPLFWRFRADAGVHRSLDDTGTRGVGAHSASGRPDTSSSPAAWRSRTSTPRRARVTVFD